MTKTEKEFEIQRALGLAEEYILIINATSIEPQVCRQKIKDAVEKHTFVSKCIAEEVNHSYTIHPISGHYETCSTYAGRKITLTFCVKCIHKVKSLIITEFQPYEVNIELRICPGLFYMDPLTIRQNFTHYA